MTTNTILNSFPGYEYSPYKIDPSRYTTEPTSGYSIYMGEDPSEGGYVFADPGIYFNVTSFDVAGMHPASILALNKFGEYTQRYRDIRDARLAIKHHDYDTAKTMLDGKLAPYLTDESEADKLSKALKLVLNSTYGFCSAKFDNPFKDSRDLDNIVAKRGALFMIGLKHEILNRGFKVVHCKTDGIKVAEANTEIADFIYDYGKKYAYDFEIEAEYERFCLVNKSVYVAKEKNGHWTATGAQFQVPYIFKTLFSREPLAFEDLCVSKEVTSALYLDFNEGLPEGQHNYTFIGKVGNFCPIVPGAGGGDLLREKDGKYNNATGAKGYKWMEAEMVRNLGLQDKIDMSYYQQMADEAIDTIKQFGDYELFVSDEPVSELPF